MHVPDSAASSAPDSNDSTTASSTRLPRSGRGAWVARLVALIVATSLCLGLLELATRSIFDANGMHYGIEMWKYARLLKRPCPIEGMGHEHIPGKSAHLMGVNVSINQLGLRGPETSAEKPAGVRRILLLGDSMTLGWGAAEQDAYPHVLEKLLNANKPAGDTSIYEVVNSGVGNYNTTQEVAYFRERGLKLNPDLVVLGYYLNDAEPRAFPARHYLARNSYLYVFASSGVDSFLRQFGSRPDWQTYYRDLYRADAPGWQACQKAIVECIDLCREHHIPLLMVLIPELHQFGADYPFQEVNQKVSRLCKEHDAQVFDLLPAFEHSEPATLWVSPGDAHPNAKGHRIIAEALVDPVTHSLEGGRP